MTWDLARLRQLAINDSGFVFDPLSGHTFTLNDTALAVVRALKQGEDLDRIVAELGDGFELEDVEDIARDVEDFVGRLIEHGLVS
jgi:PqqD family protein of HPr-rel-A system